MSERRLHQALNNFIQYVHFGQLSNTDLKNELGPHFLKLFRLVLTQDGASAANEIKSGCPIEYSIKYHVCEADIK